MHSGRIIKHHEALAESTFVPDIKVHSGVLVDSPHAQLIWARFEPGGTYRLHKHEHDQISVVLEGRMLLTVGEETREVGPGDMWFAPAGVRHGGEILGNEALVFVDIYVPPSATIKQFLSEHRSDPDE